jgi:hypothetical protein
MRPECPRQLARRSRSHRLSLELVEVPSAGVASTSSAIYSPRVESFIRCGLRWPLEATVGAPSQRPRPWPFPRRAQPRPAQPRPAQPRPAQPRPAQPRPAQPGPTVPSAGIRC